MIKKLVLALLAAGTITQADTAINGAGASFPAPVYQKWTYNYSQQNPGTSVTYQSLGSGAGLNQIKAGTIDFAGSDNPLTLDQQQKDGLTQYPMLTGGVGNIIGTFFGVLSLSTIKNIVALLGLDDAWWTNITVAAMICIFLIVQSIVLLRKRSRS